ncbi:uncharacterized protein LOC142488078 [Ascaphus truei]|uniref:uncharacterized protein LOC142488078 n=1 Tax=Ascaphus truei TaxID=8439 RepID=UPI003F5A9668
MHKDRCETINDISKPIITLFCKGMEGRYVSVVIPGRSEYLTLCEVEIYGVTPSTNIARLGEAKQSSNHIGFPYAITADQAIDGNKKAPNLARLGEASQSSNYIPFATADKAIDGNKNGVFSTQTCTHTNNEKDPWWRLDLKQSYKIDTIVIANRQDCCPERLKGAEVRVGNSADNNNPVCETINDISKPIITLFCKGMEGRYVSVVIPGRSEYLTLCEVEIYGVTPTPNLARLGEASQSSNYIPFATADKAIDGNKNGVFSTQTCTHTNNEKDPWWRLDLKQSYTIDTIVIANRQDCCPERLKGAEVRVGNSADNNNPVCETINDISKPIITLFCKGMEGRYVSVVIPGRSEYLTLCEVEIYGVTPSSNIARLGEAKQSSNHIGFPYAITADQAIDGNKKAPNLARLGEASQSSNYITFATADKAIDGNKNGLFSTQTCTHTNNEKDPWWNLDLKQSYKIDTIVITNRQDCCPERLKGAEVRVGNSADNKNPICETINDISKPIITLFCKGMEGRYVSVVIPGRSEYLTLCEVEIYGVTPSSNIARLGEAKQSSNHIGFPYAITADQAIDGNKKAPNLARLGEASQSSNYITFATADKAIDGNKNGLFSTQTCTHTNNEKDPWWNLDLKQSYKIDTIVITNRQDCCPERLKGAEVRVGNSADNKNPVCETINDISKPIITLFCKGMEGRYVSVVIPGRSEYLTLCEVEIYGVTPTPNLARLGEASQSSNYIPFATANKAIDGNKNGLFSTQTCTHTNNEKDPWWNLDLKQSYKINTIVITNRQDCCPERLKGAEVRVGNSADNKNPVCETINDISKPIITLFCKGMEGRYVSVVIPGRSEYLTLCEVEIYGVTPTPNLARLGEASQSSNYIPFATADKAIDGNKNGVFSTQTCTHTNNEKDPWWRLDLKQSYTIDTIVIANRQDCCPERLKGAEVRVGNSADNNNPVCETINDISKPIITLFCKGMEGRYVSVVIPGRSEYLTLCEVEIYGVTPSSNIARLGEAKQSSNHIGFPYAITADQAIDGNKKAPNLARLGEASQSSNYITFATADKAIDGNKNGLFSTQTCTHTNNEKDPWWNLDLKQSYKIDTIVITNRQDCCPERLKGAEVRVGNSADNKNPVCETINDISKPIITLFCKGMEGRYVSVVIPGRSEYLTLCEVEIYGVTPTPNLARLGEASQSSNYIPFATADKAIDGNKNGLFSTQTCTHTNNEKDPWWNLDLKQSYKINTIVITNRQDCCPERLKGAEVRVGNSADNKNPVCETINDISKPIITLFCKGMEGRYVSVVIPGRSEYLTLCEVEIYGVTPTPNLARLGEASQSSNYIPFATADKAIDGNKNGLFSTQTCTHTNNEKDPWWNLDLKQSYKINTIVITNRQDCCPERLKGAEVRVGNSADNKNPVCETINDISKPIITLFCKGMEGRYVSVVIPGRSEYLTLCEVEIYGVTPSTKPNLARLGEASQSSNYITFATADKAINGNKNGVFSTQTCTHTNNEKDPWWRLDLKQSYKIDTIVITNRQDCCPERLKGAEVRVGNSADNKNPVCGSINDISKPIITLFCKGMEGRYVSVVIPGRSEYLTLCEVEVYGVTPTPNLARLGEASQSSNYIPFATADKAIDGNKNGLFSTQTCTHTNNEKDPWWKLDMKQSNKIDTIVIANRQDCCPERLKGAEVRVGNSADNKNPVCETINDISKPIITLFCKGMEGRYVSVVIPGRSEYLTLCEVEIYGVTPTSNLARLGEASQSSNYIPFATADKAIDGNKNGVFSTQTCTHTNNEKDPWWRLDLKQSYKIDTIVIANRQDCCPERLKGAEVRVGNSADNNNPVCETINDISKPIITLFCKGMEGRYVSVVIPGRSEYLTLCEVEIYGVTPSTNIARLGEAKQSSNHIGFPYAITADQAIDGNKKAPNLARLGEASQSSNYIPFATADKAIDGNKNGVFSTQTCTHTNNEKDPWWRLDLKQSYKIDTIVIANRQDCCPERLKGAEVRVGNSADNNNPVCETINDISKPIITLFCKGMEGRYVSVVIPGRSEYLTLCEVEIYGVTPSTKPNLARLGEASQSSNYIPFATADKAIDGNKNGVFSTQTCTHTNNEKDPWWRLDLKQSYKIDTIVIANRQDCCPERLKGAEVRVGNSADNNNPVCETINDISKPIITLFCKGMEGCYVSVVIPGRSEYLTLCEVEIYGVTPTSNLARLGEASQSSNYIPFATADKAIDGNKNGVFSTQTCTHTNNEKDPWWRLDLKQSYKIDTIVIANRQDCCPERLKGAEVRVGNSADNNNPVCETINDISKPIITLFCKGMEGRYVSVVIPGRSEYLTLCEVEIYGVTPTPNLARLGEASQSSNYIPFATADKAIDGNKNGVFSTQTCTHTNNEKDPWWRLDLKQSYKIDTIVIANRQDCCPERLKGAEVRVGNSADNNNPVCETINDISKPIITLFCKGMEGRYVSVVIPGRSEYLTLCEVEIYGEPVFVLAPNLARLGEASQSSNYIPFATADKAIDGNKNGVFSTQTCTHTNNEKDPWWRLDLKQSYTIDTIVIANRQDCCPERLKGAEVRVGNSADNNNPVCETINDISKPIITLFCKGMEGRYVSVVIPGRSEYLTLCEVEIYGVTPSTKPNLARLGEASQSSNYITFATADKAIDGNKNGLFSTQTCTHTNNEKDPWWNLDLKQSYKIDTIVITNRQDCCPERLKGAEVRVGNSADNKNPVCETINDISKPIITLFCKGMEGRYVSVVIPGRSEYLTLCEVEIYGVTPSTNIARLGEAKQSSNHIGFPYAITADQAIDGNKKAPNLARLGEASQSSNYIPFATADKAIDGNKNGLFSTQTCTHTNNEKDPWWNLDLKQSYKINTIVITNRQDCCPERLKGAEVRVGNSADNNNPVCETINDISKPIITLFCKGMEGRYVSVVIPGRSEYLTLCEVEIYGEPVFVLAPNLARLGEASQSSNYIPFATADKAIDGNKNGLFSTQTCTHTNNEKDPWWNLDLKQSYKINTIVITNRQDCCPERLKGAEVRVGNSADNNNPVCETINDISKPIITLFCKGMEGRYVSVVIPGRSEYLTLCEVEIYGVTPTPNLARLGEASQSSNYIPFATADKAIDGNKNGLFSTQTCTHTNNEKDPWWNLDLKQSYKINTIVITNRQDCCPERLKGAEVRVGNSADNNNPVCETINDISKPIITLFCKGMEGRYVSVVIPGRSEYLTLCEVEIYGVTPSTKPNLARLGEASQSSNYIPFATADKAIDGNKNGLFSTQTCTHTNNEKDPWWNLDLKQSYKINTIVITNRQDCCPERLKGAEVRVGNSADNNNPVCETINDISKPIITLFCKGMEGRYVSVVIPGRSEYLTLCEVEIYGEPVFVLAPNLARLGEASQSSNYIPFATADKAIDGNKNGLFSTQTCTHTNNEKDPWWNLDLKQSYKINTIVITNRQDCCPERLKGAEVRVGNSADNNNPVCETINDISKPIITLFCKGMEGRYVSVVIPGRSEYLTLCEVEIYGVTPTPNLARLGEASQSSNYITFATADKAIDGNKNGVFSTQTCTHTNNEKDPWWRLDLKQSYKIDTIVITNRQDCCPERLKGAEVRVGNSADNKNPVCGSINDISKPIITIFCKGMEGRYVSVVIPGRSEYLTLCEVEVYGVTPSSNIARLGEAKQSSNHIGFPYTITADQAIDGNKKAPNLARLGEASQSSNYIPFATADKAIDGNKNGLFSTQTCTHTNNEKDPWWKLDMKQSNKIDTIVIANRQDCCPERLKGAEVRVGNSADNKNPVCETINDISKPIITLFCKGMEGRYVSVVIPGRSEYLTLCEVEIYGVTPTPNLARLGEASQSSNYIPFATADKAIDGNKNGVFSTQTCTHTNNEKDPWWRLDLKQSYKIDTIVIANRQDCCPERLKGAEVRVGNSADNNNPVCETINDISKPIITLFCKGMEGRYVSVVIPGRSEYLTLCEVEIYGVTPTSNLARLGEASQSSNYIPFATADKAIDGNKNGVFSTQTCTHTNNEKDPWWRLDLKQSYKIDTIVIANRQDCCPERLKGAEVRVGNSADNNNPVCETINDISKPIITLFCKGMEGRYVSVVNPGRSEYLTLCEVEIYGVTPTPNLARLGEASQSSNYIPFATADKAIDGNKNGVFSTQTCTHTNNEKDPWWRLDLKQSYKIDTIVIANRQDCCPERLKGAEVRVGNSADNNNPVCETINDISKPIITLFCKGMEGRYVSVVVPGRSEYLTLCEVEIYGVTPSTNIARLGEAKQSSNHIGFPYAITADQAIDGNKNGIFDAKSCTHTKCEQDPWWKLDLKHKNKIGTIVIVNRWDCYRERLKGAEVRVGNSADNNNPVCGTINDISKPIITLCCKGMEGRYVSVVIPGRSEYLTLCEVEIYGVTPSVEPHVCW